MPAQGSQDPTAQLPPRFEDDRGYIQPLVDEPVASVQLITAKKGSVRGNHRHKTDWHYCYVVSGQMEYHWRGEGDPDTQTIVVRQGEMVFTPPATDHAFSFLEDTVFLAMARNERDQGSYEDDIERVDLIQH